MKNKNVTIRVLHLLSSNQFSGAENVVCQIMEMFEQDKRFEMLYVSPYGEIDKELKERNIPHKCIKKLSILEVYKIIEQWQPTIIHAHDRKATIFSAILKKKNRKLLSHIHNNFEDMRTVNLKSIICNWAFKKAEHIFFVSDSAYKSFYFKNNIEYKSTVIRNVINKQFLLNKIKEDVCDYDYDIVFLGRLTWQKNPQRMLELVSMLRKKYNNFKVAFIGTGELEDELVMYVQKNNLEKNVFFLGYRSNPYKLLSSSKLLVMTSRMEGMPMAALEAMALGIPIISTPTDGLCDLIEDAKNGFLSNDNDILCEQILRVLENKELWKILSNNTLNRFQELSNIEEYRSILCKKYLEMV